MWFVLLFVCVIKDGDMIKSGFAMIVAITGAVVNGVYVLGAYIKEVACIKYKDLEVRLREEKKAQ